MSLRLCLLLLAVLLATRPVLAQVPRGGGGGATSPLAVQEIDGNPSVTAVTTIKVSNGSLTNNGGGTVTVVTGGTNTPAGSTGDLQTNSGSGSFSAFGGASCTNSVLTSLDSAGQGGCNTVTFSAINASAYSTDTTLAGDSSVKLPTEHAVKTYVDAVAFTGLTWKNAVRVATTGAGTLASSFENGDTVDGVVLATGDRILIKNQADQTANGVYTVAASGAPTRVTDIDASAEFNGATVLVTSGTANISSVWTQTTLNPSLGVDNIVWVAINAGTAYLAGSGLALTGNTFAVDTTVVRTTRTITVAGTANEITSSAGAQDLSANRTWTLSFPTNLDLSTKVLQGASPLVFEGATADAFETTLAVTDPTADRTITLPDESGAVCTTGSVCSGYAASTLHYVTTQAESGLSSETNLGALTTGLLLNAVTSGTATLSRFAGSTCGAGLFANAISSSGVLTCDVPAGSGGSGTIGGSGTAGTMPVFFSATSLTDSGLTDNGSTLTVNRGYRGKVASKSTNFTFGVSDYTILCTAGSGGITGTLPAASGLTGQKYFVYKVDAAAGACTLAPNGSDTLNGVNASLATLTTQHAGLEVTWESSTGWVVVSLGPLAIGDTVSGGTAGSVLWLDTGGVLAQDNAHLRYDGTNQQLQLGQAAPTGLASINPVGELSIWHDDADIAPTILQLGQMGPDGNDLPSIQTYRGKGSIASPAAVTNGTYLQIVSAAGYTATGWAVAAEINVVVDGTVADYTVPGRYEFYTTSSAGSEVLRYAMTSQGSTNADVSACTANGSTHCLAGQVEVQGGILQTYAATDPATAAAGVGVSLSSTFTLTANGSTSLYGVSQEFDANGNFALNADAVGYKLVVNRTSSVDASTSVIGQSIQATSLGGGTVSFLTGLVINPLTGKAGNKKGLYIIDPMSGGDSALNAYGLYLDNVTGADFDNYALWSDGKVHIENTLEVGSSLTVDTLGARVALASAETITAGATITADQCAGVKRLSSASAVTTSTSATFTAPASANAGCHMTVCNMNAAAAITLDQNSAMQLTGGANLALGAGCCVDVMSTGSGGFWKQTSAQLCSS